MKFLIVFIALILLPYLRLSSRSTKSRSFARWLTLLKQLPNFDQWPVLGRWLIVVILPSMLVALTAVLLDDMLWGLLLVALEIALLSYILSHVNISRQLDEFRHNIAEGQMDKAYVCAEQYLQTDIGQSEHQQPLEMHQQVLLSILHRWFEFFFLVVFWYVIADVAGLMLAWFSLQFARSPDTDGHAWKFLYWIEWLPSRLLGLTYGLAGDFSRALPPLTRSFGQWYRSSADVLYDVASGALNQSSDRYQKTDGSSKGNESLTSEEMLDNLDQWQSLHWRSMSIWMVILAVAAVGGVLL